MMQSLDAGIGRVLDAVRQGPGDDNTLVVFTSDNGGERFSKIWPFVGRKFDLLEGGLRVPQICRWPRRIEPGRITDQVSITMDLTASCLAAAGVTPDPGYPLDGVDLLPVLTGQAAEFERTLYWRMRHRYQRAVRRGGWKYLKVVDNEYLFDIEYDPRERGDLSKKRPDLLAELRKQWEDWDRDMLPLPTSAVAPMSNLSAMLW
jgi:arylsulfatase A-like enzyme